MNKLIYLLLILNSFIAFGQEEVIVQFDKDSVKTTNIYAKVDTMPDLICEYKGNWAEKVKKFVRHNIRWENIDVDYDGTVYIQFVVDIDGSISNIYILRGLKKDLDNEAIRVVSLMKNWKPGILNNKKVRTLMTIPVKFINE